MFIYISWLYTNVYLLNERFSEWNKLLVIRYSILTILYYLWLSTLADKISQLNESEQKASMILGSIPFCWLYSLTSNLALFLTTFLCSSYLFMNAYLVPMMLLFWGLGTIVQSLFLVNWWSSSSMTMIQSSSVSASSMVLGSISDTKSHEAISLNNDLVLTSLVKSPMIWSSGWWWTNFQSFVCGLWSEDPSIWGIISLKFLSDISPSLNLTWMDYSTTKFLVLKTLNALEVLEKPRKKNLFIHFGIKLSKLIVSVQDKAFTSKWMKVWNTGSYSFP